MTEPVKFWYNLQVLTAENCDRNKKAGTVFPSTEVTMTDSPIQYRLIKKKRKAYRCSSGRNYHPSRDLPTPMFMPVGTQATVKVIARRTQRKWVPNYLGRQHLPSLASSGGRLWSQKQEGLHPVHELGPAHFDRWWRAFQVYSLADTRNITEEGVTFKITPQRLEDVPLSRKRLISSKNNLRERHHDVL